MRDRIDAVARHWRDFFLATVRCVVGSGVDDSGRRLGPALGGLDLGALRFRIIRADCRIGVDTVSTQSSKVNLVLLIHPSGGNAA
jgi:hypothetical protein